MASIVSAGTTSATALNMSADTTGILQLASNNGTVALTVSTGQLVGIGNTSPAVKLDVLKSSGSAFTAYIGSNVNVAGSDNGLFIGGFDENTSKLLYIQSNTVTPDSGSSNTRFLVRADGLVGVGTGTPASASGTALVVHHSSTPRIRLTSTTTGQASSDGAELSLSGSDFYIENREAQNIVFYSGSERARIDPSGNFLVGTTTAVGKLTVNGAINSATYAQNITAGNTDTMFTMAASQSYVGYVTEGASNTHSIFFASCAEGSSTAVVTSIYQSSANTVVSASGLNIRVFNGSGGTRTMKMTVTRLV
jgi:hypothetical protein